MTDKDGNWNGEWDPEHQPAPDGLLINLIIDEEFEEHLKRLPRDAPYKCPGCGGETEYLIECYNSKETEFNAINVEVTSYNGVILKRHYHAIECKECGLLFYQRHIRKRAEEHD